MRAGIVVNVTRADRHRLEAIVLDRIALRLNRASLANAPPSVRVEVATITNQLDPLLTHAHPSLAFKNIEAAASGYDQQQQNPANPPAGQKQGGAVEQKEESAKFDPRSIGARQARDGHLVCSRSISIWKISNAHTPNEAMALAWIACCSPDALINGYVEPGSVPYEVPEGYCFELTPPWKSKPD